MVISLLRLHHATMHVRGSRMEGVIKQRRRRTHNIAAAYYICSILSTCQAPISWVLVRISKKMHLVSIRYSYRKNVWYTDGDRSPLWAGSDMSDMGMGRQNTKQIFSFTIRGRFVDSHDHEAPETAGDLLQQKPLDVLDGECSRV